MDKKFLTIKAFAEKIYYSERQVRQMCIDGKLTGAHKIPEGRKWLIPESALTTLNVASIGQQKTIVGEIIEQKPYEETPHKQKMRELAKKLTEIRLPSVRDTFEMGRNEPRSYPLLSNDEVFFVIELENREIAAFADLEGTESTYHETAEANFAWKMLFTHLETGGFLEVIDKIKYFEPKMYAYLECCHEFYKLVKKRIEDDTGPLMPPIYSEAFGFTPFSAILICVDAVQTYDGLSFIDDSSYRIEEKGSDWVLTCNGLVISIADSKGTLNIYEKMHKDLRLEWASRDKREQTEAITKMRKDLEGTVKKIRKDLFTFAGKDILPGHCELCSNRTLKC